MQLRLSRASWIFIRLFVAGFVAGLLGMALMLTQGARAPETKIGIAGSVIAVVGIAVCFVAGIGLSVISGRELIRRYRAGERFTDFDPFNRD
jgi:hypothetical protein